ncbi:metallophosphoesterase family protein [Trujillonella humicola]|uniref:metallophosphoesterase family protein n=1 Tax=Trujillonella humicola TaxID=3383699 RepID=UPI00390595A6
MRIVHAADLHIDSPLQGLSRLDDEDVARQVRQASRRATERLVRLVIDEEADALVLAGDVYDGDWPDYATGRFFAEQMDVLHDHGVPVFSAAGNHDAESQITRALTLPSNVRVLSTREPETVVLDDLGLAVHGQGYPQRAVTENLVAAYPRRVPGLVNVGILHTAVAGSEGHAPYAPCTVQDLERADYDYFALGHVHRHAVVTSGHRVAAYSGNLQGRHPRETGPKGAVVVDVEPDGRAELRHVALDIARWAACEVDATGAADLDDVLARVQTALRDAAAAAEGRLLVARVTLRGATRAAAQLADRERLAEEVARLAGRCGVTVERVRSKAEAPGEAGSVEPQLRRGIEAAGQAMVADLDRLRALVRPLDAELGRILRQDGGLDLRDDEALGVLAAEAVTDLLAQLTGEGR